MKRGFSLFGTLMFFFSNALTVTVALTVYSVISHMEGWRIALIELTIITALSLMWTLIDFLRRRFVIERVTDEISAAAALMAKGNYDISLTPRHRYGKYDEYDMIMISLNTLAEELSKTEIMRGDFISNVSHEIKTPLSVISNYASALKKTDDKATREKYTDVIVSASKRLSDLTVNILKLNKLENSALNADLQPFDLSETLREGLLTFEEIIDKKQLELDCDIEDMQVNSDKSLMETVFVNLISNAVKFTPEGGKISVSLKGEGDKAVICVADTGCGIDGETGKHIFDKFYQGDTSHSSEGNGLGLAMVKRIIDILGGDISVRSKPGEGSAFTVKIRK